MCDVNGKKSTKYVARDDKQIEEEMKLVPIERHLQVSRMKFLQSVFSNIEENKQYITAV